MARRGRPPHPDILTPAEWRVLEEVRTGATNAEIAVRLGIQLGTVKFHVRNMRHKLHLETREELAAWRPEPKAEEEERGRLLAPLALFAGFWKPAVSTVAVVVVGGAAIAAGVLAYAIANSGELSTDPALPASRDGTPSATPEATAPPATPSPTPSAPATSGDIPAIHFWGDIPEAQQVATRARTADVVEFFEARYGVRVPDLEVHIGANDAALDEATLSAEGASAWVGFGQYRDGFLFIRMDVSEHAIEHLYFHAIQDYLAEGRHWGPWWLGEGAAVYATHLYQDARDERSASEAMDFDRWASSHTSVGLQELEADSPVAPESFSTPTESLAALAVAWLIQEAGEDSLIAYYQLLPESERWTEAFESAFGLPFSEVYPAFAAYRAEVVAVRRDVTGVVLGPDGEPVEDWRVDVEAFPSGAQRQSDLREHAASEDFNGDFTSRLPDGTYALSLSTRCGRGWVDLGWYGGETGFTTSYADATDIFVEGQDVEGLTIRLPALPDEMFPERCSYGPRVAVSGVVIGPDGQPRSNVYLSSHDPVAGIWPDNTIASADGSFTLHLPAEAAYQIGAGRICEREGKSIVISGQRYAVESDTHANDEGHVVVASADITGITVQLLSPFECGSSGQQG